MPKTKLDQVTLKNIAQMIFQRPGYPKDFFDRIGLTKAGGATWTETTVDQAYLALRSLNEGSTGDLVAKEIEQILLRLVSPLEHESRMVDVNDALTKLNHWLQAEELELVLDHMRPRLQEAASAPTVVTAGRKVSFQREQAPDFRKFVTDNSLSKILSFLWGEAQRCIEGGAYLAAVLMMGSILEGMLLHVTESKFAIAKEAKAAPKDKTGKTRAIHEWTLHNFIEVAHELHWLGGDITKFSHALRESRNFVHPHKQRQEESTTDFYTAAISWHVVRAAVHDLMQLQIDAATPTTP
ncbi:MAG TPA: hypothetical protein VIB39_17940 [Candidatus Angelobacter sp.]